MSDFVPLHVSRGLPKSPELSEFERLQRRNIADRQAAFKRLFEDAATGDGGDPSAAAEQATGRRPKVLHMIVNEFSQGAGLSFGTFSGMLEPNIFSEF